MLHPNIVMEDSSWTLWYPIRIKNMIACIYSIITFIQALTTTTNRVSPSCPVLIRECWLNILGLPYSYVMMDLLWRKTVTNISRITLTQTAAPGCSPGGLVLYIVFNYQTTLAAPWYHWWLSSFQMPCNQPTPPFWLAVSTNWVFLYSCGSTSYFSEFFL